MHATQSRSPNSDGKKAEYPEPLPPTLKLDAAVIDGCVSRLYKPEVLLTRTLEEKKKRQQKADLEYTIERDPHLQIYWHRQGKRRQYKRLPPLKTGSGGEITTSPSTDGGAASEAGEAASTRGGRRSGQLVVRTGSRSRSLRSVSAAPGSPRMLNDENKGSRLKKKDLTALAILVQPPAHFQNQVNRLDVAGQHRGCYDLRWMLGVSKADVAKMAAGATTAPNGRPLLTLDDLAASTMAQEDLRPDLPRGSVLISSPRSAVCCLRFGIPPSDLLTHRIEWFQKQVALEGAPAHISQRRFEFFESERQRLLAALSRDYHTMKQHTSLKKLLQCFHMFNPDSNYDYAGDHVDIEKLSLDDGGSGAGSPEPRRIQQAPSLSPSAAEGGSGTPGSGGSVESGGGGHDDRGSSDDAASGAGAGGKSEKKQGNGGGRGKGQARRRHRSRGRDGDASNDEEEAEEYEEGEGSDGADDDGYSQDAYEEEEEGRDSPAHEGGGAEGEPGPSGGEQRALATRDADSGGGEGDEDDAGRSPGAQSGGSRSIFMDETIKSREEVLKDKCQKQLEKAKKKLQGHLVRTILLARVKQKNSDDRRQKMDERLQRFQDERDEKIRDNRRRAAEKAETCKQVLEESRALQREKMNTLIRKQEEGEARRVATARQLQMVREVKREDASLKVKKKIEGVVRQRNAHEWTKLCVLDRVRRKHDRADFAQACLHDTLDENKYKREEMLRENETVMKMLHRHML